MTALGSLFGAVFIAAPMAPALAFPLPETSVAPSTDVQSVTHAHGHYSPAIPGYRPYLPPGAYYGHRPYYRPYYRPYIRPDAGIYVVPRTIHRTPYPRPGINSHIGWCQARYRSYDPVTDLFLTYSGDYRACLSPYR